MPHLHLLSPRGFKAGAAAAGIKSKLGALDVALLLADSPATAAATFTLNRVFAAPVKIGREHVAGGKLRGVVVNAGNANACTGKQGEKDARRMCTLAAELTDADPAEFLPSSTGIIGHLMPMDKIERGITDAARYLGDSQEHALRFADAILTTDLVRKAAADEISFGRHKVRIAGVCKGSGMIGPRMALTPNASPRGASSRGASPPRGLKGMHATMLAYVTTDAAISAPLLRQLLGESTERSFNAVTVDDHTSTNDTAVVLASGASGVRIASSSDVKKFAAALDDVCTALAYQIARDGEGATKVVKIVVTGAKSDSDAKAIARSIANSPLVKCAMHGNDPNWGRIVSAAGYCGAAFDPDKATLRLQGTPVFRAGRPLPFDAAAVSTDLASQEAVAELSCGLGKFSATIWTCDFSREYVAINADYHT